LANIKEKTTDQTTTVPPKRTTKTEKVIFIDLNILAQTIDNEKII